MELGRSERAIEIAREAVRLKPTDSGLQANLALIYWLAKRIADSQMAINQALKVNPTDKMALDVKAIIERFAREGITFSETTSRLLSEYARLKARSG